MAARFEELCGPHVRRFFAASTFLRLARDGGGSVGVAPFLEYVRVKDYRLHLQRRVAAFDQDGDGWLTPADVEAALLALAGAPSGRRVAHLLDSTPHTRTLAAARSLRPRRAVPPPHRRRPLR